MANVMLAALKAPSGLWPIILNWIEKAVVNYGWVIILFTLLVKVCLMPLDFLVKYSSKKTSLVQQKLAPQLARINRKYANDPNQAKIQTNALYKREGFNGVLSCLVMIFNLVITMVVFFTLFASLREISGYRAIKQYIALEEAYMTEYNAHFDEVKEDFIVRFNEKAQVEGTTLDEVVDGVVTTKFTNFTYDTLKSEFESGAIVGPEGEDIYTFGIFVEFYQRSLEPDSEHYKIVNYYFNYDANSDSNVQIKDLLIESGKKATDPAGEAATAAWKQVRENWLWVDNIWVADNYKSPLPSYDDLMSLAKNAKNSSYTNYVKSIDRDTYNVVTGAVRAGHSRWNGYFILAILAGVTSFLSQWITEKMSKTKNKRVNQLVDEANPTGGMMKFMKFLMPALMIIFVLTSSAGFGIYIVASSIISIAISAITSLIIDACFKKKQAEVLEYLEKETIKGLKKNKKKGQL